MLRLPCARNRAHVSEPTRARHKEKTRDQFAHVSEAATGTYKLTKLGGSTSKIALRLRDQNRKLKEKKFALFRLPRFLPSSASQPFARCRPRRRGEMKVSVKTLKGSSFQIEVNPADKVPIARPPDLLSRFWLVDGFPRLFRGFGFLLGSLGT